MRLSLSLTFEIERDKPGHQEVPIRPDLDTYVEHADHDSTPRPLGFQPNPQERA